MNIPGTTTTTTHSPISTQDEYDALLKEILESDSSGDEHSSRPFILSRTPISSCPSSSLNNNNLDLDLDLDFDIHLDQHNKIPYQLSQHQHSNSDDSTPRNSIDTQKPRSTVSIVIEDDSLNSPGRPQLHPHTFDKVPTGTLLPERYQLAPSSHLSLSSPSSASSSPSSSSIKTLTRASSVESSSNKNGQNNGHQHSRNTIQFLNALSSIDSAFLVSSSIDVDTALDYPVLASNYLSNLKSFKQRERNSVAQSVAKSLEDHQRTLVLRHEQRLARYNQRHDSLFKQHHQYQQGSRMDLTNQYSRGKQRENGTLRNGRDASSISAPIVLKGSNTRLVNGLQSITALEQHFNELRIPELELLNTPETTIRAVLADLYKISEELHMHLQGGALSDGSQNLKKDGVSVVISGESQRQKRIKEIMDRIVRETSLYEEFVRKSNYLSLDAILNEVSDEEDQDLQGFGDLGGDDSEMDSASDIHREDTLSQTSFMSANNQHGYLGVGSLPGSPMSALSYRSLEPLNRLRPHAVHQGGAGSVASSSAITGRHSRTSSVSFSVSGLNHSESHSPGPGAGAEPWETFRWTPLLKLSEQLFSDEIKASSGLGTCITVSNIIAVGTSRGSVLVYSTSQALIGIYGSAQYALEHGSVCSIAISSDNTYMVCGHSLGSIIVWNISKPSVPSRIIPPITKEVALSGRKLGHIRGAAVLNVGFIGIKRSEVVSADDQGMSFHHLLYKVMMVNAVETTRLLGKYPAPKYPRGYDKQVAPPRQSTVFGMGVLPYGQVPHSADSAGLVALLTPFKMLIVCVKPQPQTLFKFLRPKDLQRDGEVAAVISGNLAWFPATKSQKGPDNEVVETNPLLAFSWNRHLYIFQVVKAAGLTPGSASATGTHLSPSQKSTSEVNGKSPKLDFVKVGDWICREGIVGIQWVRPQILLLLTNTEDIIVFDPKLMCETERCSARSLQIVYHDWFRDVAKTHRPPTSAAAITETKLPVGDMCYNSSWRVHKGKLFVLGVRRVQVGTILNWTDRILALVKSGDFLEGIALATLFYTGKSVQAAVVGLPEDEDMRKKLVGEKIYELLTASLNYTFNPERMLDVDADVAAGGVGAGTVLFHDLAIQAIESCLAIDDQAFLFEDVYERYGEANTTVKGIFLQTLEGYILQDRVQEMPPQVMQAFVKHYSDRGMFKELELCICHTPCHVLEMHQIVDLCQRHKLYTALIYVWNKSIGDYVSPVVELLKVIKSILKSRRNGFSSVKNVESGSNGHAVASSSSSALAQLGDERALSQDEPTDEEIIQKLYEYLSDSLLGKSYIDGAKMDESQAVAAKVSLYSFIFSGRCVTWPSVGGKLILTGDAEEAEPTYPYLRLFLRHDSEEFLRVIDRAFEDGYLASTNRDFSQVARGQQDGLGKVISRQLIINTLLEVLTPSTSFSSSSISELNGNGNSLEDEYSAEDIAHLYSFVARNYAKSPKSLALSPTTLHRILTRLSSDTDESTREERQVAVQALLRCYSPGDESGMMSLYEQAGFYRVLEKMHRSQKQYGPMIITYLKDPERRSQVFEAIRKLLDPSRAQRIAITEKQRTDIVKTAMENIAEIVDIDGEQAALLVHRYLNAEHRSVLETLHGSKPRLFAYLRGLLEPSNTTMKSQSPSLTGDYTLGSHSSTNETVTATMGASSITDPAIHEQYVELLCQYDPSGVYDYLERHQDNSYRLERVLKICQDAGVVDAVVWILERSGNVGGALNKVLEIVQERIDMLATQVKSKGEGKIQDAFWSMEEQSNVRASLVRLRGVLNVGKQLCERRSQKAKLISQAATMPASVRTTVSESETETLWFRLLQVFVAASRRMTLLIADHLPKVEEEKESEEAAKGPSAAVAAATSLVTVQIENAPPSLFSNSSPESEHSFRVIDQLSNNFKGFVQSILATLLLSTSTPQVSLPSLLRRLLKSESADEGGDLNRFSDFKDIFLGMLDTFKYEGQLLEMTNGLFERDLFMGVQLVAKSRAKGWRPRKGNCEICGGAFWGPNIVRELWVQQQRAAAHAIKAALRTSVNSDLTTGGAESPTPRGTDGPLSSHSAEPSSDSSVMVNGIGNKEKNSVDKDLLLFRCGHGYHRQCLEMETSASSVVQTTGARALQPEQSSPLATSAVTLNCAVCNGLVKASKAKPSSRPSSRTSTRGESHHHRHHHSLAHQHASSSRTSATIPVGAGRGGIDGVTVESPRPGTASSSVSPHLKSTFSPSPPPQVVVHQTNGHAKRNKNLSSSSNATITNRPRTPPLPPALTESYYDSGRESPGPGGYQNSNEYEAATSPSMRVDKKGKQRAQYQ